MMRKYFTALTLLSVIVAGCSSQARVDNLEHARSFSDEAQSEAAAKITAIQNVRDPKRDFIERVDYPLIGAEEIELPRSLTPVFSDRWSFTANSDRRLVDVLKELQAQKGLTITIKDDVYNPNSADPTESTDASYVNYLNEIRTEDNLAKEGRLKIPGGSGFDGTVSGFLDYVTSLIGVSWDYSASDDRVVISRYIERSYHLVAAKNSEVWASTVETIDSFTSEGGQVRSNPSAGMITVVDKKDVHNMVRGLVEAVNRSKKFDVITRVEIYSVRMSDEDAINFGLNLSRTATTKSLGSSAAGTAVAGAASITASILSGSYSGSELVAQSLSSKSEITSKTSQTYRSANHEKTTISETEVIPVLTAYTPPVVTDAGIQPASASLTDKTVGFSMDLTPAVHNNGKTIQMEMLLSSEYVIGQQEVKLNNDGQFLQSLRTKKRTLDSTFTVSDGETIILAGLKDSAAEFSRTGASNDSWFSWLFGIFGISKDDAASQSYYVIALTPIVEANGKL